ncbi:hypothetical protein KDW03_01005 [Thermospira aquatica]|uniref:Transposase n=1 Tax=Thermospira aquatica TaxID=2828656 RepID=A0AAX3BDR5_9SPIR|nr:hypothetical protein KDW03_01005 [Thermospira aquatica]
MELPEGIRSMVYTNNALERLLKNFKRRLKQWKCVKARLQLRNIFTCY